MEIPTQAELIRAELLRLLKQTPFRKFVISLNGGEQALIEHPENIAFDPRPAASSDFYILTGSLRLFSRFEAVSSISVLAAGAGIQNAT